ncbi:MAG: TetR/AcrR family transcriptional regulator [Euryarchaeota archaeon]|nr:TetR/AcrR family transcriptional regulator [Euryarchaeota archaeon]MBV1728888.1 TetR/AcrR family transcriptional regulator [Methanobacterium sp.]MBV1754630.1 TetR/AcrR family transcriptional regulator [Methanobacterium sp.]MBV1767779.1 TetR/AcrR family transcriptional regulator [Methanobacterium sp.]
MSILQRREREKKKRRQDIINAAEKLFFSKGYDNVSMNDIAREVELSKATLYLYFQNKETLFFAIVVKGTRLLNSMIRDNIDDNLNGLEKVNAYRNAYYDFTRKYPDYIHIYNYFQSGRFSPPQSDILKSNKAGEEEEEDSSLSYVSECAEEVLRLRNERFFILQKSIEEGIADGTIRPDIDPVETAILLSAISKSLSHIPSDHERLLQKRGISHDQYFQDVSEFILLMIKNLNP